MKLSKQMFELLNDQYNYEVYSAHIYLNMSALVQDNGYFGASAWMYKQYCEELTHAKRFFEYMIDRDDVPQITTMENADLRPKKYIDLKAYFELALQHEERVTARINKIYQLALDTKDYATKNFLEWFVAEQVEEENQVQDILDQIAMIERCHGDMFTFDQKLGARSDTPKL